MLALGRSLQEQLRAHSPPAGAPCPLGGKDPGAAFKETGLGEGRDGETFPQEVLQEDIPAPLNFKLWHRSPNYPESINHSLPPPTSKRLLIQREDAGHCHQLQVPMLGGHTAGVRPVLRASCRLALTWAPEEQKCPMLSLKPSRGLAHVSFLFFSVASSNMNPSVASCPKKLRSMSLLLDSGLCDHLASRTW